MLNSITVPCKIDSIKYVWKIVEINESIVTFDKYEAKIYSTMSVDDKKNDNSTRIIIGDVLGRLKIRASKKVISILSTRVGEFIKDLGTKNVGRTVQVNWVSLFEEQLPE